MGGECWQGRWPESVGQRFSCSVDWGQGRGGTAGAIRVDCKSSSGMDGSRYGLCLYPVENKCGSPTISIRFTMITLYMVNKAIVCADFNR